MSAMPAIIAHQCATLGEALWLHVTAPILALAVAGFWSLRRERVALVIGPWALLCGLPRVFTPTAYITPRHLVYVAVPILVLAAGGLLAVLDNMASQRWARWAAVWVVIAACIGLAATPSIAADAAIIASPVRTPLIAFDRWQYISGWPSGYVATRVASFLRRQTTSGPVTVLMPPGYFIGGPLSLLMYGDRGVTFSTMRPALLSMRLPRPLKGRAAFVLAYRPSYTPLTLDDSRLRQVLHAPTADGDGACDLYRIVK